MMQKCVAVDNHSFDVLQRVLWGYLLLHEAITTSMLVACAVILAGTTLATGTLSSWR